MPIIRVKDDYMFLLIGIIFTIISIFANNPQPIFIVIGMMFHFLFYDEEK